jgi:hypothetical protein
MLCDSVAQQNHLDVEVKRLFFLETFCSSFSPTRNDTVSRNGLTSKVSASLECIAFALRAWCRDVHRNGPSEMLYIAAMGTFPCERAVVGLLLF